MSARCASIVVLGPILARLVTLKVSDASGCTIGSRPIDLHLRFGSNGAKITQTAGYNEAKAAWSPYSYGFSSVSNQKLDDTAAPADGVTVIENAAREPEIVDLAAS